MHCYGLPDENPLDSQCLKIILSSFPRDGNYFLWEGKLNKYKIYILKKMPDIVYKTMRKPKMKTKIFILCGIFF